MVKVHKEVRNNIEKANEQYKKQANKKVRKVHNFEVGDLVWIHLRKERFPSKRKHKLMPRAEGPYEIVEKVNENAYKVDLGDNHGVSATFNVGDLAPYLDDDELRAIPFQEGEDDVGESNGSNKFEGGPRDDGHGSNEVLLAKSYSSDQDGSFSLHGPRMEYGCTCLSVVSMT